MPLVPLSEAINRVLRGQAPLEAVEVDLDGALGRHLFAPLTAVRDQPPFDNSAMDGYAFRFPAPEKGLLCVGESRAGAPSTRTVGVGEGVRIFTGAALPEGADTVVPQEDVVRTEAQLQLTEPPSQAGRHVRLQGRDFKKNDVLLDAQTEVTPAVIGLLASQGQSRVSVHRAPRVALFSSGDELVPIERAAELKAGQILESNSHAMEALLAQLGAQVVRGPSLPDELVQLSDRLLVATQTADLVVTTGGASVGDYDLLRPAIEAAGGEVHFSKVRVKPGKPVTFATLNDTPVLVLPGNPTSALVTAELFLTPLVLTLLGARDPHPRTEPFELAASVSRRPGRTEFVRGEVRAGKFYASEHQGSGSLRTLANAGALLVVPADVANLKAGDPVQVLILGARHPGARRRTSPFQGQ